jgi:hypothetical protein
MIKIKKFIKIKNLKTKNGIGTAIANWITGSSNDLRFL